MEAFIYILFCFLALIGVATVIRGIAYFVLRYDLTKKAVTVIFLDDNSYEMTIRAAYEQYKWKKGLPKNIVALDNGLSSSARAQAKLLLNDYNIALCNKEDIFEKLREKL